MGIGREASPRKVGVFLVWLGAAIFAALLLFLLIFHHSGHKASVLKNSRLRAPFINAQFPSCPV